MREARKQTGKLAGKEVAFTGRLASMSRIQARELIRAQGGNPVPAVSSTTSILVVGQDGWPLRKNGKLTRNLERARLLAKAGQPLAIVSEEDFLASLGLVLLGLLLARFGVRHAEKIPLAVAGLLIAFLLLQSLRFVFPRGS